jgi:hypothetical protein
MCGKPHNMSQTSIAGRWHTGSSFYRLMLRGCGTSNICIVFSANCDGTIIYNNPVVNYRRKKSKHRLVKLLCYCSFLNLVSTIIDFPKRTNRNCHGYFF